jgi:hypothetical protein
MISVWALASVLGVVPTSSVRAADLAPRSSEPDAEAEGPANARVGGDIGPVIERWTSHGKAIGAGLHRWVTLQPSVFHGLTAYLGAFDEDCDPDADDDGRCILAYAIVSRGVGDPIGTIYALDNVPYDHPEAARLRAAALADVRALITAAAMEVTQGEIAEARRVGPRAFARALRAQIAASEGGLEKLVHPDRGVFVVHNIPGHLPNLDHVRSWPRGDFDYSEHVDDASIDALKRAHRWRPGVRVRTDEIGCESIENTVVTATGTALDGWAQVHGASWDVPEEAWLISPEDTTWLGDRPVDAEALAIRAAALTTSHTAFVFDMRLDFGRIDGRWYLLAMDIQSDFCG